MVNKRKPGTAVNGARFGVKAGSLLLGISLVASCSMFGEESSPAPGAEGGAAAAEAAPARVDPDALGVVDGLPPDTANQRYDDTLSRRPVTTVRPLEEEPASAEAPAPEPQASVAPRRAEDVESEPVAPVQAAAAPQPVAEPQPAPEPEAQPVAQSPTPSAEQNEVLVAREAPRTPRTQQPPAEAAPAAPQRPTLSADTTALDQAVAAAYGGVAVRPQVRQPAHPDALIPGAVVGGPRGGAVPAGGPVVIGGPAGGGAVPMVTGGNGPVVIGGGPRGGVAPAVTGAPSAVPGLPAGGEPIAVIQFPFGAATLDARDRRVLRQVADIQARQGGFVKVVGHSSLFTANMPQDRHKLVNFTTSVARAEAVADALRREGVPAEVIDVAAVGDREPLYLEVMPSGEAGNRRVEIFLVR